MTKNYKSLEMVMLAIKKFKLCNIMLPLLSLKKVFEKQGCEKGFKQKTDNEKQAVFELAPKTQILEG